MFKWAIGGVYEVTVVPLTDFIVLKTFVAIIESLGMSFLGGMNSCLFDETSGTLVKLSASHLLDVYTYVIRLRAFEHLGHSLVTYVELRMIYFSDFSNKTLKDIKMYN